LTINIASEVPVILSGDEGRLQQILVNLVSNAIKFTQAGAVQVHIYCPDAAHWAMQVTDTGPGIPGEAHEYIFEPFRQVDGSVTRHYIGTGLGLSIVKQLTTLMAGRITLESQVGQGSTFTVLLPLLPLQEKIA
jgi:signal transduction histidine kinase